MYVLYLFRGSADGLSFESGVGGRRFEYGGGEGDSDATLLGELTRPFPFFLVIAVRLGKARTRQSYSGSSLYMSHWS